MRYINPKMLEVSLQELKNTPYFVDKTGLILESVKTIGTKNKYLCITRPRRFGKTINAQTLAAFLAKGLNVAELFDGLEVTNSDQAMQHFGTHDVIYIDFSELPHEKASYQEYIDNLTEELLRDLGEMHPEINFSQETLIFNALKTVFERCGKSFCFVMDEWDSMFQNWRFTSQDKQDFLIFLKQLLKDKPYVEFAYMTGVMPIAKHSSGSELNMFTEFSAVKGSLFDDYFGFSRDEVRDLCQEHLEIYKSMGKQAEVNYEKLEFWYDGYLTKKGKHVFNPRSVVLALQCDEAIDYWTESGPNFEVYDCIKNNIADVRDDVARMVAGEAVEAKVNEYSATSRELITREQIFSAMVVFGMLTYYNGSVSIPNYELMIKFQDTLENEDMGYIAKLTKRSKETLIATLEGESDTVAKIVEAAHDQEIPLLRYKNEADLAAVINLVYLYARNHYHVEREKSAGKGVADVAFIPKNAIKTEYSPFVVELKVAGDNETAEGAAERAIEQIKSRDYLAMFKDALIGKEKFNSKPLAVAISWDPKNKEHACRIEEIR